MQTDESEAAKWREMLEEVVRAPTQMAFEVAIREARALLGVRKERVPCETCKHEERYHSHPINGGCTQPDCQCMEFVKPQAERKQPVTNLAVAAIKEAQATGTRIKVSYSFELALELASLVNHHGVYEDTEGRYVYYWDDDIGIELR